MHWPIPLPIHIPPAFVHVLRPSRKLILSCRLPRRLEITGAEGDRSWSLASFRRLAEGCPPVPFQSLPAIFAPREVNRLQLMPDKARITLRSPVHMAARCACQQESNPKYVQPRLPLNSDVSSGEANFHRHCLCLPAAEGAPPFFHRYFLRAARFSASPRRAAAWRVSAPRGPAWPCLVLTDQAG